VPCCTPLSLSVLRPDEKPSQTLTIIVILAIKEEKSTCSTALRLGLAVICYKKIVTAFFVPPGGLNPVAMSSCHGIDNPICDIIRSCPNSHTPLDEFDTRGFPAQVGHVARTCLLLKPASRHHSAYSLRMLQRYMAGLGSGEAGIDWLGNEVVMSAVINRSTGQVTQR